MREREPVSPVRFSTRDVIEYTRSTADGPKAPSVSTPTGQDRKDLFRIDALGRNDVI
jgi:hypothetical protein